MTYSVVHIVDDASFGGVNRMLDHMTTGAGLEHIADSRIVRVRRGQLSADVVDADIIVSHLSICWANFPMLTSLRANNPSKMLVHVEHSYSERFSALNIDAKDRFDTLMTACYSLFDKVVAVSMAQARWIERRDYCGLDRLVVIEPCVNLEPYMRMADRSGPGNVVGAIGRFTRQKGFDILVSAFRALPRGIDIKLHLYGDGEQREELEQLADGDDRITLMGFAVDTALAIAACDIIAMPSRWEPYGLVAIEAMAAGRPVVCARVDGLTDHISQGAVEIGENTPAGWTEFLTTVGQQGLSSLARPADGIADMAQNRFAARWVQLITKISSDFDSMGKAA